MGKKKKPQLIIDFSRITNSKGYVKKFHHQTIDADSENITANKKHLTILK